MAKSLTLKKLEQDKAEIEKIMKQAHQEIQQLRTQILRLDGALGYVKDNIKNLTEKEVQEDVGN